MSQTYKSEVITERVIAGKQRITVAGTGSTEQFVIDYDLPYIPFVEFFIQVENSPYVLRHNFIQGTGTPNFQSISNNMNVFFFVIENELNLFIVSFDLGVAKNVDVTYLLYGDSGGELQSS